MKWWKRFYIRHKQFTHEWDRGVGKLLNDLQNLKPENFVNHETHVQTQKEENKA